MLHNYTPRVKKVVEKGLSTGSEKEAHSWQNFLVLGVKFFFVFVTKRRTAIVTNYILRVSNYFLVPSIADEIS